MRITLYSLGFWVKPSWQSGITGSQQGIWAISSPRQPKNEERRTVSFTKKELEDGFIQTKKWENDADKTFGNFPMISIYYEDLVNNTTNSFNIIADFLGVKHIQTCLYL